MKKILLAGVFLIFITLSACGAAKKDSLDGEWVHEDDRGKLTLTVSKNKYVLSDENASKNITGNVDRKKNKLMRDDGRSLSYEMVGDKLVITGTNLDVSLERKE